MFSYFSLTHYVPYRKSYFANTSEYSGPGEMQLGLTPPRARFRPSSIINSLMVEGGTSNLRGISGSPTWLHPLRIGVVIVAEGLRVALAEITAGRLLGRYILHTGKTTGISQGSSTRYFLRVVMTVVVTSVTTVPKSSRSDSAY